MTDGNRTIIETPRLLLREMTAADRPDLCMILQDKEVMYAYNGPFSDEEVNGWLERQTGRYREWGYGLWAVVLKQTGEMIGQCGVTRQLWNGEEMLEVGYLFRHSHWHQGYATEAARACMEYAFNILGASEVCSIIRDNNIPSQRVALRNGMRKAEGVMVKHYRGAEMPHWLYLTSREEFSDTDGRGSGKDSRILTVRYQAPCGEMLLGSLGDRLCLCDWTHELHPGRVANRLRRILKAESEDCGQISGDTPGQSAFPEILLRTVRELDEYFRGERKEFDIPLLLAGSEFQKRVWQQLRHIPYGHTVSYGELAAAIGAPKSVRAVANANGANAISIIPATASSEATAASPATAEESTPNATFWNWNPINPTRHYEHDYCNHGDMLLTDTYFKDYCRGRGCRNGPCPLRLGRKRRSLCLMFNACQDYRPDPRQVR